MKISNTNNEGLGIDLGIKEFAVCSDGIKFKNINKTFGDYKASDNVNFGIEKGKLIGLLGPSGSGKTTILRMIAGLENPDSGEIVIDGKVVNDIPASKRGIGFVFQNYALFRYMTVFDNIAFGLKIQKKSKKFIKERVNELVKLIGLEGLEKRYPSQLSGGQKQRVAFARALAPKPLDHQYHLPLEIFKLSCSAVQYTLLVPLTLTRLLGSNSRR